MIFLENTEAFCPQRDLILGPFAPLARKVPVGKLGCIRIFGYFRLSLSHCRRLHVVTLSLNERVNDDADCHYRDVTLAACNIITSSSDWLVNCPVMSFVYIRPNSTWLVTSRLDTTRNVRRVQRVEPCCSNMADDEQAIVLACTSLVVVMLLHT